MAIDTQDDGGVRIIRINRPDKKNALTQAMYRQMTAALQEADASEEIGAVLLTGTAGVFTAGNDLSDFLGEGEGGDLSAAMDLLRCAASIDLPLVAAVEGPAIGIGTTILLHCDFSFAAPDALFKAPFIDLAVCPEGASSLLLERRIGAQAARAMLMLGEGLSAERAAACGLLSAVSGDPQARALETAKALAAKPRMAMRETKSLLRSPERAEVLAAIDREAAQFERLMKTPAAQAIFAKFLTRS
ncbi:MAG: enoyl-CoA hydratase-related protein [Neomegalonema sp.]|nr:enoyl-CoA hydratase-related protein [Neomegalonema sp.]